MENNKPISSELDQDVVNLTKSVRQVESGHKFDARGGSGEYGGYQFMPATWKGWSAKHLGKEIPLEKATPEQQNEVAYKQMKEWKDAGHNVGEIASLWNSGNAQNYLKDHRGVNKYGVKYDTPAYAKKVAETYQSLKEQSTPVSPQNAPGQAEPSLMGQLGDRLQQAVGYGDNNPNKTGVELAASAFQKDETPGIADNIGRAAMGVADVAGAIGGGIGDVVGAVIGGGVSYLDRKLFNNKISKTTEAVLSNPEVKAGIEKYQEWAKENPVASRQVGNAFNIVTSLIPAAKSYKAVKSIATGGIAAEMGTTYTGRNILKEAAKTGVDPMVVMREAADSMPDRWWKQFVNTDGASGKKFHASLLKEPIDDMIAREAKIIQKYSPKGAPIEPGSIAKISEAKKKIAGLRNVKDLIDEIAKKPGEKGFKNKIPVVKYFASDPKQGLISRALLEKGSKASKTQAKSTLKKTLPVMAGSSITTSKR